MCNTALSSLVHTTIWCNAFAFVCRAALWRCGILSENEYPLMQKCASRFPLFCRPRFLVPHHSSSLPSSPNRCDLERKATLGSLLQELLVNALLIATLIRDAKLMGHHHQQYCALVPLECERLSMSQFWVRFDLGGRSRIIYNVKFGRGEVVRRRRGKHACTIRLHGVRWTRRMTPSMHGCKEHLHRPTA